MSQKLKTLAALVKDLGLNLSTHNGRLTAVCNSCSKHLTPSFDLHVYPTHTVHIQIFRQRHIHISQIGYLSQSLSSLSILSFSEARLFVQGLLDVSED